MDGKAVHYYDLDSYQLGRAKPVYETVRGWHSDISSVRQFADLPTEAQVYIEKVEELVGVKVGWIGVGPEREAVIEKQSVG